ncbi:hypothetical protein GWI33_013085, partial [Rhynchophorus ferrugineus]
MRPSSTTINNISTQCDRKPFLSSPHSTTMQSSMPSPPSSNTPHSFYEPSVKYGM